MRRVVKDLFHLLSREDNPESSSEEALANLAFKEMDANKDGKVTEKEFVAALMNEEKITSMLSTKLMELAGNQFEDSD